MRSPPNDRDRLGQDGFSLIETLVMLTMFGIVAGLVLECAIGGVAADQRLAARAEDGTVRLAGAAVFHALLRDATLVRGDHRTLEIAQHNAETLGCAARNGVVRLSIEAHREGGRLTCAPDADRRPLLRWQGGNARFSYSDGTSAWNDRPPSGARLPMLVRLELVNGPRDRLAWTERVGVLR